MKWNDRKLPEGTLRDAASCLTAGQVDTVRKIYAGAEFNDGTQIYTGFERGSELTWTMMIEKEPFSVNLNYFKGMVFEDPDWDFRTFILDRDTRLGIEKTATAVEMGPGHANAEKI